MTGKKPSEIIVRRLDLPPALIQRAKLAYAKKTKVWKKGLDLETIAFRQVMDHALDQYLDRIANTLRAIGLLHYPADQIRCRQRPITATMWNVKLECVCREVDVAKVQLIRAALDLLAQSED